MGWKSFCVVGFDLGPLVQGQTRIAKLKIAYNLLSGYCFHPWCPDGRVGRRLVGKSLSGLYLRNRKV